MRLIIDSCPGKPAWNMAVDEALLVSGAPLTLRLYTWKPAGLSLGFFQPDLTEDECTHWKSHGVQIVRRLTGGGAILHAHEITYSLTGSDGQFPFDGPVDHSYQLVHDTLIEFLKARGIPAHYAGDSPAALKRSEQPFFCFTRATSLDVMIEDKKLIGSAKRRRGDRALQHGSIVLAPHPLGGDMADLTPWADAFSDEKCLTQELAEAIASSFGQNLAPGTLSPEEHKLASQFELEHANHQKRRR